MLISSEDITVVNITYEVLFGKLCIRCRGEFVEDTMLIYITYEALFGKSCTRPHRSIMYKASQRYPITIGHSDKKTRQYITNSIHASHTYLSLNMPTSLLQTHLVPLISQPTYQPCEIREHSNITKCLRAQIWMHQVRSTTVTSLQRRAFALLLLPDLPSAPASAAANSASRSSLSNSTSS